MRLLLEEPSRPFTGDVLSPSARELEALLRSMAGSVSECIAVSACAVVTGALTWGCCCCLATPPGRKPGRVGTGHRKSAPLCSHDSAGSDSDVECSRRSGGLCGRC